jgi:hypothetical protein
MQKMVTVPRWVLVGLVTATILGFGTMGTVFALNDGPSSQVAAPSVPTTEAPNAPDAGAPDIGAPASPACSVGPREHRVHRATSTDGLTWTFDDDPIVEQASVPDLVVAPNGDLLLVFVDASDPPESAAIMRSTDGGETFERVDFSIEGLPEDTRVLDPNLVVLPDGRLRLYYFGIAANVSITSGGQHTVYSAISDDGVHFVQEGIAYEAEALVDPDVFEVADQWVMYVFGSKGTEVATSTDGTTFGAAGLLSIQQVGTTGPITLADGRLLLYGFEQTPNGALVLYDSTDDGITWEKVDAFTLELPPDTTATDPQVVRLDDGTWQMVLKIADVDPTCTLGTPRPAQ